MAHALRGASGARREFGIVAVCFVVTTVLAEYFSALRFADRLSALVPWLGATLVASAATAILLFVLWLRRLQQVATATDDYRTLFHGNPYPMWIYDVELYRIAEVNEAACRKYGYSREEFLRLSILDIRPAEDRDAVMHAVRHDGPIHGRIWRHVTKDGRQLRVEITSQRLRWLGRECRMTLARDLTEQYATQERLRESEEELRLILDSTGDGFYAVDLDERCVWCNPAAARSLGFTGPSEVIGRNMHELVYRTRSDGTPYPQAECEMILAARRGEGIEGQGELLYRNDGSSFHADYISNPILRAGVPSGAVVRFTNVEPRHQAEAAKRQSESRLRSLVDANVFGVAVGMWDGRMAEANDAYLALVGYTRADLAAGLVRWDTGTAPEYREYTAKASELLLAGKPVAPWRAELVRKDGARVPVLVALVPQPDCAISITLDLTELQKAESSLRAAERRYRGLFERNLAAVFVLDSEGRFLDANEAMARIAGVAGGSALIGEDAAPFIPNLSALIAEVSAARMIANRELTFVRAGDHPVPVLANISYVMGDATGAEARIEATAMDLTDFKNLEAQFLQAQKMEGIGQLAGGVAHDFNNLLTVINGYCDLALAQSEPGEGRRRLELIAKAGARAAALTNQLLAFSRKQVLELRVLDLNEVLRDGVKLLRPIVGESFDLELALDPKLYAVKADANKLTQVLMNLVVNAKDAMPAGGRITVESHNIMFEKDYADAHHEVSSGRYAMIAVTDRGQGMDEATRARVFEPFFTTKPAGHGTGLGLATVFGIVKQSGGAISIYSAPGAGTSVKVYLPAHDVAGAAAEPHGSEIAAPPGTETILFVEDEELVRDFGADALQSCGYRVIVAADPGTALRKCEEYGDTLDLLVTDVIMPGMDGPTLAARLRAQWPGLRTLFVSGYPSNAIANIGGLALGDAFLQKPYTADLLATRVRNTLDGVARRSQVA